MNGDQKVQPARTVGDAITQQFEAEMPAFHAAL
jgi:hypothetical protein